MNRLEILSPKIDFVFKRIFGNEKHPKILISFLNSVMTNSDPIESVEILNTDIEKEHIDDKFSRLDIKAKTNKGEVVNIEIQLKNEYNMIKRSLYYWSKMYENQLGEGQNYDKLARTVCINILNFKYLKSEKAHTCYRLKELKSNEELTDVQEIHFIELPKMPEADSEITDVFTAWIEFIKNPISSNLKQMEMTVEEIREAKEELFRISSNEKERMLYEDRRASLLDKVSALENAERKGLQKGLQQGLEKGLEQGLEKGKKETAKNLLDKGLDVEFVSEVTGLSVDEIKML